MNSRQCSFQAEYINATDVHLQNQELTVVKNPPALGVGSMSISWSSAGLASNVLALSPRDQFPTLTLALPSIEIRNDLGFSSER